MIVGITGSIATGKSTVTKYLQDMGYRVIDSDAIVHDILREKAIITEIIRIFGETVLNNGEIDRKVLGNMIFKDPEKRQILNSIIHPQVIRAIREKVSDSHEMIFVDIPLLFEAKLEYLVDKIIVVYTKEDIQLERLMKRDQIEREYAVLKVKSQMDIEEKKRKADFLVNNDCSVENTHRQIEDIVRRLQNEI